MAWACRSGGTRARAPKMSSRLRTRSAREVFCWRICAMPKTMMLRALWASPSSFLLVVLV